METKLSKQVCKACSDKEDMPWNEIDERYWLVHEMVDCPYAVQAWTSIYALPPEGCPHRLVHAIMRGLSSVE